MVCLCQQSLNVSQLFRHFDPIQQSSILTIDGVVTPVNRVPPTCSEPGPQQLPEGCGLQLCPQKQSLGVSMTDATGPTGAEVVPSQGMGTGDAMGPRGAAPRFFQWCLDWGPPGTAF